MHIFFYVKVFKGIVLEGLLLACAGAFFACNQETPEKESAPAATEQVQPQKVEQRKNVKPIPFPVPMVYRDERVVPPPADTVAADTVSADTVASNADAANTVPADTVKVESSSEMQVESSSSAKAKVVRAEPEESSSSEAEPPAPVYCENVPDGMLCDRRDGQMYRTVAIGTQVWMAQNLNYHAQNSWCYDNKASNCNVYGRLYSWTSAMGVDASFAAASAKLHKEHQGACPDGFHMPTSADMKALVTYMNKHNKHEQEKSGTLLKMKFSWMHSEEWPEGTDRFGFGAMAAGFRNAKGSFKEMGKDADFWVAEESNTPTHAPYWNLYYDNDEFLGDYSKNKLYAYSVRCLKNTNH